MHVKVLWILKRVGIGQDNLFFSKKKRKMKLLTIKQQKPYENAQISNICQTNEGKYVSEKIYYKVRDNFYHAEDIEVLHINIWITG